MNDESELDEMLSGLQNETNEVDKEFIINVLKKNDIDYISLQTLGFNGDDLFYRALSILDKDEISLNKRLKDIKSAREEIEAHVIQRAMIRKGDKIIRQGMEFSLNDVVEYFQAGEVHNPSPEVPVIERIKLLNLFYDVEPKLSYNWKHLSAVGKKIAKQIKEGELIKWCKSCWEPGSECKCKEPETVDFPPFLKKVEKKTIKIKEKKT